MPATHASPFRRVVIKLSGEALKGSQATGLDGNAISSVAERIAELTNMGVQVAIVVGGGNFFRGLASSNNTGIHRTTGDAIGMLATMMNGLALRDGLEAAGVKVELMTAKPVTGVGIGFSSDHARKLLNNGICLIFAGGTGCPFFSTDTTSVLRACEIDADAILKATKVDGVYTADPKKDGNAKRFRRLNYGDALKQRLGIMDSTAFSMCMDNNLPIVVFDFNNREGLKSIIRGDFTCGTLVGPEESEMVS